MPLLKDHPAFELPKNPAVRIWRYMDFAKFVSMLEEQKLFFSRIDKLGDPFEGSYSLLNKQVRNRVESAEAQATSSRTKTFIKWARMWTMVNCWHMNEYESAAMWRLYSSSFHVVAITSTFESLRAAFDDSVCIGIVRYIDYSREYVSEGDSLTPFLRKRRSYEHEREIRALVQNLPGRGVGLEYDQAPSDNGILVPANLERLVHQVYVAPDSPRWFRDLVAQAMVRYGHEKEVLQSSLNEDAFF